MPQNFTPRTAKGFLISRVAEEAERQGAPLSEVERKMLYWTEMDSSGPEDVEVSDEFDRDYKMQEYEAKISKLIKQAYQHDQKASPAYKDQWKDALLVLQKGDHYILVMVDQSIGRVRTAGDRLRLVLTALVVTPILCGIIWLLFWVHGRFQPTKIEQFAIFASFFLLFWLAGKLDLTGKILDAILTLLGVKEKDGQG